MTDKESKSPYESSQTSDLDMHLAYAEASVMLIECLMLVLMEKKVLPLESLVEAVETAIEAKRGLVKDGAHPQIANIAAGVLSKIANSLAATGEDGSPPMPE
jgi:hypothetical protein